MTQLTPANLVDFLNLTFETLSQAEAADKSHKLDDSIKHYETFISRAEQFLASPLCALLQRDATSSDPDTSWLPDPNEIRGILPGVQLRLQRLTKMRQIRDTPPVPGAIPLTGPNAGASLEPEAAGNVAKMAAAAAAAKAAASKAGGDTVGRGGMVRGAAGNGEGALGAEEQGAGGTGVAADGTAQRLEAELLRGAAASAAAVSAAASGDRRAEEELGKRAAAAAAAAAAAVVAAPPSREGSQPLAVACCGSCGKPGVFPAAAQPVGKPPEGQGGPQQGCCNGQDQGGQGRGAEQLPRLLRCGGCREAFYCSPSCQRSAWPAHKATCRRRT